MMSVMEVERIECSKTTVPNQKLQFCKARSTAGQVRERDLSSFVARIHNRIATVMHGWSPRIGQHDR